MNSCQSSTNCPEINWGSTLFEVGSVWSDSILSTAGWRFNSSRKRHLDRHSQLPLGKGLHNIAIRTGQLGSVEDLYLAMCRHIHNEDITLCLDTCGGFHAVHISFKHNIHQYQVGRPLGGLFDRLFTRGGRRGHLIAKTYYSILNISRDDGLVFDDKDPCPGHGTISSLCSEFPRR